MCFYIETVHVFCVLMWVWSELNVIYIQPPISYLCLGEQRYSSSDDQQKAG